jgi:dethiobiotin synthetase
VTVDPVPAAPPTAPDPEPLIPVSPGPIGPAPDAPGGPEPVVPVSPGPIGPAPDAPAGPGPQVPAEAAEQLGDEIEAELAAQAPEPAAQPAPRPAESGEWRGVVLVTGTDTDVGKTIVTAAIAASAQAAGLKVAVIKPGQTGTTLGGPTDVELIQHLAAPHTAKTLATYPEPLAPLAAARVAEIAPRRMPVAGADSRPVPRRR